MSPFNSLQNMNFAKNCRQNECLRLLAQILIMVHYTLWRCGWLYVIYSQDAKRWKLNENKTCIKIDIVLQSCCSNCNYCSCYAWPNHFYCWNIYPKYRCSAIWFEIWTIKRSNRISSICIGSSSMSCIECTKIWLA